MRMHAIFVVIYAIHLAGQCGTKPLPSDIKSFAVNAEACEHLGGEYDGNLPQKQKRQIELDVQKYCGAASRQLPILRKKYRHDPAMLKAITRHTNEAVTDYR